MPTTLTARSHRQLGWGSDLPTRTLTVVRAEPHIQLGQGSALPNSVPVTIVTQPQEAHTAYMGGTPGAPGYGEQGEMCQVYHWVPT